MNDDHDDAIVAFTIDARYGCQNVLAESNPNEEKMGVNIIEKRRKKINVNWRWIKVNSND